MKQGLEEIRVVIQDAAELYQNFSEIVPLQQHLMVIATGRWRPAVDP